jgi:hypothetical protein
MFPSMQPANHPSEPEFVQPTELRSRAEQLRKRSRVLRAQSTAALRRRDATVHRLEIRRELLQSEYAQLRTVLRGARAALARADDDLQDWMAGEVLEMITGGWGRKELAEVGIGPEMLRGLGLDDHPALG